MLVELQDRGRRDAALRTWRRKRCANFINRVRGGPLQNPDVVLPVHSHAADLPDVPTPAEAGFPDLTFNGVNGIYGWRGMPESLKARIAADVREIASDRDRMRQH